MHYRNPAHKSRAMEVFEQFNASDIQTTEEIGWQTQAKVH
jgi:hypothetical protein